MGKVVASLYCTELAKSRMFCSVLDNHNGEVVLMGNEVILPYEEEL